MNSNKNKLILNDTLDQIFANDYRYDSHDSFNFTNIDFILLNNINIQMTKDVLVEVILTTEFLIIHTSDLRISLKYDDICNFSIQEA